MLIKVHVKSRSHHINALFNLAGGASAGLMVLVLPFLLNRMLSQSDYAAWVLGFQAALYVPMFGLGVHQLLNSAIAQHLARAEYDHLERHLASGLVIVAILASLALFFVLVGSFFVMDLAKTSTNQDLSIVQVWLVVGGAASLGLFSLFFFGCFGGQQRYEWENLYRAIISIGFITLILLSLGLGYSIHPIILSQLYFAAICTGLLFLLWRFARQPHLPIPKPKNWHFPTVKSYVRGMYGLSIWQVGMLMVSGFDVWIVAKVDFGAVPGYSIALSFLVFLSGSIAAIAGPCLPRFSAELSLVNHGQFRAIFLSYQGKLIILIGALCVGLLILPQSIWFFLLKDSALTFNAVFPILLLATCLRLVTILYALSVVAANIQHRIILSPLLEGVINLFTSIVLAYWLGPIGVAIGTLIGSVACLAFHALYNIPRTLDSIPLTPLALICPWKI